MVNAHFRIYGILILLLMFSACAKNELPEDHTGEPSFFAEGTIDGEPLFFSAGPGNVVVASDFEVDENELAVFSSSFIDVDCQICSQSLFIELVGAVEYEPGLTTPEYILTGDYALANYEGGESEPLFAFEFNEDLEIMNVFLESLDGDILFMGEDIPDMELPDGVYNLSVSYQDSEAFCFGSQDLNFMVEEGEICGDIPSLEISDEGILTFEAEIENEGSLLVINDFPVAITGPVVEINLEELLDGEMLKNVTLIDLGGNPCPVFANWTFGGFDDAYCVNSTEISQIDVELEHTPMTALIKYTDADFNTYVSNSANSDFMNISNLEEMAEGNGNAYRCNFLTDTYLINTLDETDSVHFVVNQATIPIGME